MPGSDEKFEHKFQFTAEVDGKDTVEFDGIRAWGAKTLQAGPEVLKEISSSRAKAFARWIQEVRDDQEALSEEEQEIWERAMEMFHAADLSKANMHGLVMANQICYELAKSGGQLEIERDGKVWSLKDVTLRAVKGNEIDIVSKVDTSIESIPITFNSVEVEND